MTDSWINLFRSAVENVSPIVLSLATADSYGDPSVRCVICRRITDSGGLWFVSDSRSQKNAELLARPSAAAACWLAESRQQFRFRGPTRFITDEAGRKQTWGELSPTTRAMFFWPQPGAERADATFISQSDEPIPPETFSLISLEPQTVEHLVLSVHPHRRRRWTLPTGWYCQELNP
jgi:PPOX class probable FMN-dependent enzyme